MQVYNVQAEYESLDKWKPLLNANVLASDCMGAVKKYEDMLYADARQHGTSYQEEKLIINEVKRVVFVHIQ